MSSPNAQLDSEYLFSHFPPQGPDNPDPYELRGLMCTWLIRVFSGIEGDRILVASRISDSGAIDGLSISDRDPYLIGHMTADEREILPVVSEDASAQLEMGLWVGDGRSRQFIRELVEVAVAHRGQS